MLRNEFNAIIQDIESNLQGDGYFILVTTKSGARVQGGYRALSRNDTTYDVVVIDDNAHHAHYVPLSQIESIQRSTR
jgi:hypothetical protein